MNKPVLTKLLRLQVGNVTAPPELFISTNFTDFEGSSALIASHNRRTASVTNLRGWPYIPFTLMLCPRAVLKNAESF